MVDGPDGAKDAAWVDGEVHLFPPEWCRAGYRPPAAETAIRRLIYEHPEGGTALSRASVEGLLAEMDAAGVDRAVIMGLPWQDPEMCWRNNAYIAQAVRRYPDRFVGLGVLPSPDLEDPRDGVSRIAEQYGLRGVKVVPSWHGYRLNDPAFEPAIEQVIDYDMVLMPHTDHLFVSPADGDAAYGLYAVARRFPDLRILAPHLGGLLCLYNLFPRVAGDIRNVLFITSVPATMPMVEFAAAAVGVERLAFGTDFPFNPSHDQRTVMEEFEALRLDDSGKALIRGENLLRFLES